MKVLIFDIEITGHHCEYLEHLVNYIQKENSIYNSYYFVVHPEFNKKFPLIATKALNSNIKILSVTKIEINNLYSVSKSKSNTIINSYKQYNLLLKYANILKPDKCIIMFLDRFLKPLSFKRPEFEITGILFTPFVKVDSKRIIDSRFKYLRRRILRYLYTRNKKIKKIFILNNKKVIHALNKQTRRKIFHYLPDPLPEISEEIGFNIRMTNQISSSKKILLHLGSLRKSKGTIEILQSLNLLSDKISSAISLIIAGNPINEEMDNEIKKNLEKNKKVQIIYVKGFLTNSRMKAYLNQCDIIIMPYKNFLASSGIIGHAIASNKPVIANKNGLIGEIIKSDWKGELVFPIEPMKIAVAIEKSIKTTYPVINNSNFIKEHTPYNFAKTLLHN